jgi:hypothetical protein
MVQGRRPPTATDMLGYRGDHFRVGDDPGANGRAVLRWLARFPDKWPTLPNTFLNATRLPVGDESSGRTFSAGLSRESDLAFPIKTCKRQDLWNDTLTDLQRRESFCAGGGRLADRHASLILERYDRIDSRRSDGGHKTGRESNGHDDHARHRVDHRIGGPHLIQEAHHGPGQAEAAR